MHVRLNPQQWSLLGEWVMRPTDNRKHKTGGGMQQRRKRWLAAMNPSDCSIALSEEAPKNTRATDDVTWIIGTIVNQYAGGFQSLIAKIFTNTHPRFTGLSIKPRKSRTMKGGSSAAPPPF
jgi:hypothetical protein